MQNPDVIIVGGGLAGLTCARVLGQNGRSCLVLEAADEVGGRARTDKVDGFLLDRGFQVLLTAYPEAQHVLDYDRLALRRFEPGALVRWRGRFHRFVDPWRSPRHLWATAVAPVATLSDKLRVAALRRRVCRQSLDEIYAGENLPTIEALRAKGFSDVIIERFFRPFLGGVFLDRQLETSSRLFHFVFKMFAEGDAALPADGMGQMARQLAQSLPAEWIRTDARVVNVVGNGVTLEGGEALSADQIVLACEAPAAARLGALSVATDARSVSCVYFAAPTPPLEEPLLVLNGDGDGPINNLCVPSQVAPRYAPSGQSLVSVSVLGDHTGDKQLHDTVQPQLEQWFGRQVGHWRHLRTYHIAYALPAQPPSVLRTVPRSLPATNGIICCGDYLDTASINGAMASGARAAQQCLGRRG